MVVPTGQACTDRVQVYRLAPEQSMSPVAVPQVVKIAVQAAVPIGAVRVEPGGQLTNSLISAAHTAEVSAIEEGHVPTGK